MCLVATISDDGALEFTKDWFCRTRFEFQFCHSLPHHPGHIESYVWGDPKHIGNTDGNFSHFWALTGWRRNPGPMELGFIHLTSTFLWRLWSEAVKTVCSRNFYLFRTHIRVRWGLGIFCGHEGTLGMFWGFIGPILTSLTRLCARSYVSLIVPRRSGSPCVSSSWNVILYLKQRSLICITNSHFSWTFLKSHFKHCFS